MLAAGCADAPSEPPVGTFGPYTLDVDEVVELVAVIEEVPADVNALASITVLWADFVALAELMTHDPELVGTDFDAAVGPVVEQETINSLRELRHPLDTAVGEEELLAAYEATEPPVRLSASHILLARPANAAAGGLEPLRQRSGEILASLNEGASFAELARRFSDDPGTAAGGGSLGDFAEGEMLPEIETALSELEPGEVGGPVETHLGVHVVRLDGRSVLGLEAASDEIRNAILLSRRLSADSAMVAAVEGGTAPEVVEGAVDLVRELATRPGHNLSGRAAARSVAAHPESGNELTLAEVRYALLQQGIGLSEQIATAPDEDVGNYLVGLLRRKLLLARARAEGLDPDPDRIEAMRASARTELLGAGRDLGLHRLDAAPGEAMEPVIERTARSALERVLQGGADGLVLGAMTEEVRRGRVLVLDESALGRAVLAIGSARMNRSASPAELSDTAGIG